MPRRPRGEYRYSSTLSLTSALYGGGWSTPRPGRFTPGKDPVPIGPQGRSGQVRKVSPPGFDPRTVHPVASRYTDWAVPAHCLRKKEVRLTWRVRHALSLSVCLFVPLTVSLSLTRTNTRTHKHAHSHTPKASDAEVWQEIFASLDSWRMLYKNYILIYLRRFFPVVLLNQYILFSVQSYTNLWYKF